MQSRDSMNIIYSVLMFIIVIGIMAMYFGCDKTHKNTKTYQRDTVYVPTYIEIPTISGSGIAQEQRPYEEVKNNDTTVNYDLSTEILQLLAQRDSLTTILEKENITVPITLCESIKSTGDSICIKYDEITRKLDYSIQFAPRKIDVPHIKETIVEEANVWEKIGYGVIGAASVIVCLEVF